MKLLVFGPTGGTGRQIVSQALAAGHEVTAFTRDVAALRVQARLTVVSGETSSRAALQHAIAGSDAVLCALGGRPWRLGERVCFTAVGRIAPLMAKHGVRRIVAMSTFGAGDTRALVPWLPRTLLFGAVWRSEVADKEAMERQLTKSELDWTVVRTGLLTNGAAQGTWRAADDGSLRGMGRIARADVAAFMLAQLTSDTWLKRRPALMY